MRGFFCEPRKPFFPILKRKIFLGIFGWKLLTIKITGFVLFYFLWCVCFWRELTDYKSARSELSGKSSFQNFYWCAESQETLKSLWYMLLFYYYTLKKYKFVRCVYSQLRQSLKLCRSSLCWSSLCWSSLCRS